MSKYFDEFPIISYNGRLVKNITLRPDFIETLRKNPYLFYPYQVQDDETAEDIANFYYGNPELSWVVYMANDIVDPYTQWPMSQANLERTIACKYHDQALIGLAATGDRDTSVDVLSDAQVIRWASRVVDGPDENGNPVFDNVAYYESRLDGTQVTPLTFTSNYVETGEYLPVRYYDLEFNSNEDKRNINLLDNEHINIALRNLRKVMNG